MKKIALLYGGFSGEAEISKKSAEGIHKALLKNGHDVFLIRIVDPNWMVEVSSQQYSIDKNDFTFTLNSEKITFDKVFNIIHGSPGEDGKLSGYFELLGIEYNSAGLLGSALTFNKNWSNRFLSTYGIIAPKSVVFFKGEQNENLFNEVSFPCFVKPNNGGSSIGTHKAKDIVALKNAIADAFEHDAEVIVEEFIEGREFSCGIFKSKKGVEVMPLTEIIPKSEFFDYKDKYSADGAQEITPAVLPIKQIKECQAIVAKVFSILRLKKVARIDFILKNDKFYLIEVNTIPGMSPRSILPQQALHVGYSFEQLVEVLLD
ncbi:MAG: D-alanine-D-alanine ligase [Saprospiraceae bacterium]|jgi:D-alanine-D-alanine ligase